MRTCAVSNQLALEAAAGSRLASSKLAETYRHALAALALAYDAAVIEPIWRGIGGDNKPPKVQSEYAQSFHFTEYIRVQVVM
jgi:hypothetical protein